MSISSRRGSNEDEILSLEAEDGVSNDLTLMRSRRSRPSVSSLPSHVAARATRLSIQDRAQSAWSTANLPASSDLGVPALGEIRKLSSAASLPATLPEDTTSPPLDEVAEKTHFTISMATTHALTDFSKFIARQREDEEQAAERRVIAQKSGPDRKHHNDILQRLKLCSKKKDTSYWERLLALLRQGVEAAPKMPTDHELLDLAHYQLPPRPKLKAIVCDFGDGKFERHDVSISELEYFFEDKPAWSQVRWIHAPLGLGLFHSSVEDIFLKTGIASCGRPFTASGRPGFPYLETDSLNLRSKNEVQNIRDTFKLLYYRKDLAKVLDSTTFDGNENTVLREDVEWRAGHLRTTVNYWDTVQADVPRHLADTLTIGLQGPLSVVQEPEQQIEKQVIGQNDFFRNAHLVSSRFRCFHRKDGYILSLSAARGIDYLDGDFEDHLSQPSDLIFMNRQASVVAQVVDEFSKTGTKEWHRATVEWFTIYLLTEIITTPHNVRSGLAAPNLLDGYQRLIRQMKQSRYRPWERQETARLVHQQLACADELSAINVLLTSKCDLLRRLERDVRVFESEDRKRKVVPNNVYGQTSHDRIKWARAMVEEQVVDAQHLMTELQQSMTTLFQLRSIEQNELAIAADIQNKAVTVFAAVTVIFLPLSFFTGYFGMNIQGIQNSKWGVDEFWRVCGTISLLIVVVICMYAFRHKVTRASKFDASHY